MKFNRYHTQCHSCDGQGFVEGQEDNEGYTPREACRWCYRGVVTIKLTADDEKKLLAELQKNKHDPKTCRLPTCDERMCK